MKTSIILKNFQLKQPIWLAISKMIAQLFVESLTYRNSGIESTIRLIWWWILYEISRGHVNAFQKACESAMQFIYIYISCIILDRETVHSSRFKLFICCILPCISFRTRTKAIFHDSKRVRNIYKTKECELWPDRNLYRCFVGLGAASRLNCQATNRIVIVIKKFCSYGKFNEHVFLLPE